MRRGLVQRGVAVGLRLGHDLLAHLGHARYQLGLVTAALLARGGRERERVRVAYCESSISIMRLQFLRRKKKNFSFTILRYFNNNYI